MRWRTEAFDRQTGSVTHQDSKSEQRRVIEFSNQVNSPVVGEARTCGNGADCVQDTLAVQMGEYFFDDRFVLDSGDYPGGTVADSAPLYIDVEYSL